MFIKRTHQFTIWGLLILSVISCHKVPITGRRQINLLPETQLIGMSLTNYDQFLKENKKLPANDPQAQRVINICKKLQGAVEQFMVKEHMQKKIKNFKWEYNVVEDPAVNAWCMPGGKIVVYTGLIPVAQTDEGLATVIGHEIAHAIARHGNERMSTGLATQLAGVGLGAAMSSKPQQTQNLFLQSFGMASNLGTLKFSRNHESEADKMGLVFMALAGYDPSKSVDFWQRMSQTGGAGVPEFLSTHPSHDTRIKRIQEFLPEAMQYYKNR